MKRFFKKKQKPPQTPQLGTPTEITVGSPRPPADPGIGPKDDGGCEASRIAPNVRSEDQRLVASDPSTSGTVVYGTERRYDPMDADTRDAGGRETESTEKPRVAKRTQKDTTLRSDAVPVDVTEARGGFGPLKAALGAIPTFYVDYQESIAIGETIEVLLSRTVTLEEHFATRPYDAKEQRRRSELIRGFMDIEGQLRSLSEKPRPRRLDEHVQDDEKVPGILEDLREIIYRYQMMQKNAIYDQQCRQMSPAEAAILNNFHCADGAEFRHGERKECLKGTRRAVLSGIELWAKDFDRSPIYWLNGLAGTGKSTIAKTVADRLFADGQLGASFFCSRDFEDRSNLRLIFPTLAIQLARKYTGFRAILTPLIQSDPGVARESLYSQMEKLIVRPLDESRVSTVIVIDALDECRDEESTSAILSVLGRLVPELKSVKFFLTGRPEPRVSEGFRLPLLANATDVFVLHQVEPFHVDRDVRLFLRNRFLELASRRRLGNWPTAEQLDRVCERAAGLFVYAAATVKFLDNNKASPRKQLDLLLESQKIGAREGRQLDSLYTSILQEAFGDDDEEVDVKMRSVLGVVILAVNPLPPSAIATLLGLDADDILPLLTSVNSLLILQDADDPVKPFHKSFPDFITDQSRCTNERFHISPPHHHSQLLVGCLDLMCRKLEKNMCKLPDGVANSDVRDLKERTERYIDPALRYACRSWHSHLVGACTTPADAPEICSALGQFLEKKLLFWLEVLSFLGVVRNGVEALQATEGWLKESPMLALASDCFRFVTGYFEIISASAPHIYHSALAFAPQESTVRKLYESHARPFARVVRGAPISWDSNTAATTRPSEIMQAVWSPCDRFIAIVWGHTTIDVLDSVTLQRLQTFESPENESLYAATLVFSPDSRILACSSGNHATLVQFVSSWDLQTGGLVSTINWQVVEQSLSENPSVAYSTNGEMVGVLYRLYDQIGTIVICDVASGTYMHSHSLNQRDIMFLHGIWTHGEALRFATHDNMAITIWEVGFTSDATPTEVEVLPILNFPECTQNLAWAIFLPALYRLGFVSADGVVVWDLRASECLLRCNDTILEQRISFSSDGRFFCATGGSGTYLWKESPTGYILHEIPLSNTRYFKPLLSLNGESIVVFGNRTVRSWRTTSPTTPPSTTLTRAPQDSAAFVLDFSPDRTLAVVAKWGRNMATVLDLKSGVPQLTIDAGLKVHGLRVVGNTIVILGNGKLVTWNLPTGNCVPDTRVDLEDSAWAMDFGDHQLERDMFEATISSDFRYIAAMRGGNLDVYSATSGKYLSNGSIVVGHGTPWFAPGGRDVWYVADSGSVEGWRVDDEGEELERLELTVDTEHPPEGYPWASSCGYRVTDDWWVLGPDGKRLLMLPPPWQSPPMKRVWKGQFLVLRHYGPPEPVILDLDP